MRNEQITLVTKTGETFDADGYPTGASEQTTSCYAEIKSVGRTEFYQALQSNVRVSIIFSVDWYDFQSAFQTVTVDGVTKTVKPSEVTFNNERYLIVRTFKSDLGTIEITCREVE